MRYKKGSAKQRQKEKGKNIRALLTVGERSNFKKIPTHTQDHGDA